MIQRDSSGYTSAETGELDQSRDRACGEELLRSRPVPPNEIHQQASKTGTGRRKRSQREAVTVHLEKPSEEGGETAEVAWKVGMEQEGFGGMPNLF